MRGVADVQIRKYYRFTVNIEDKNEKYDSPEETEEEERKETQVPPLINPETDLEEAKTPII